jgi:hypothetical protein
MTEEKKGSAYLFTASHPKNLRGAAAHQLPKKS